MISEQIISQEPGRDGALTHAMSGTLPAAENERGRRFLGSAAREDLKKPRVLRLMRQRGTTLVALAKLSGVGRAQSSAIFRNKPGRGAQVRKKVARFLRADELALAGWDRQGNLTAEKAEIAGK